MNKIGPLESNLIASMITAIKGLITTKIDAAKIMSKKCLVLSCRGVA